MRRLGLAVRAVLVACSASPDECTSACDSLLVCRGSPACTTTCCQALGAICDLCTIVCRPESSNTIALASADCVDACSTHSSTEQTQILQCVTAAASCADAFSCE
jgi:hypothetical protein